LAPLTGIDTFTDLTAPAAKVNPTELVIPGSPATATRVVSALPACRPAELLCATWNPKSVSEFSAPPLLVIVKMAPREDLVSVVAAEPAPVIATLFVELPPSE
jgi:hypothetical protein